MPFFMSKKNIIIYLSTLFTAIIITMFISSFVTFISLGDKSLFLSIWPLNWFYAILIAFPAIIIFRPFCQKLSEKFITFFIK